jgi:hypothetical protein
MLIIAKHSGKMLFVWGPEKEPTEEQLSNFKEVIFERVIGETRPLTRFQLAVFVVLRGEN